MRLLVGAGAWAGVGGARCETRLGMRESEEREGNASRVATLGNIVNKVKMQTVKMFKLAGERVAKT